MIVSINLSDRLKYKAFWIIQTLSSFTTFLLMSNQLIWSWSLAWAKIFIKIWRKMVEFLRKQPSNISGRFAQLFNTCTITTSFTEISSLRTSCSTRYYFIYLEHHQDLWFWMGYLFSFIERDSVRNSYLHISWSCQQAALRQQNRYMEHRSSHIRTTVWNNSFWD